MAAWRIVLKVLADLDGCATARELQLRYPLGACVTVALKAAQEKGLVEAPPRGYTGRPWRITPIGWAFVEGKAQEVRVPGPAGNGWMAKGRVVLGYNWLAPLVPTPLGRPPIFYTEQQT